MQQFVLNELLQVGSSLIVSLQLDAPLKKTLSELFFSAQTAPALQRQPLTEDGLAIFRIAKEFSLTSAETETRAVDAEDLARLIRYSSWLLTYGGFPTQDEQSRDLRALFTTVMLQTQAQFADFEALLSSFGVDRQLAPLQVSPRSTWRTSPSGYAGGNPNGIDPTGKSATHTEKSSSNTEIVVERSEKTHQVQIQVRPDGTDLTSTTNESKWTARGWKQSTKF